jgi:hypothetical protein
MAGGTTSTHAARALRKLIRADATSKGFVALKFVAALKCRLRYWKDAAAKSSEAELVALERLVAETARRVDLKLELSKQKLAHVELINKHKVETLERLVELSEQKLAHVELINKHKVVALERLVEENARRVDLQLELTELKLSHIELHNKHNVVRDRVAAIACNTPHAPTRCSLRGVFPTPQEWEQETIEMDPPQLVV